MHWNSRTSRQRGVAVETSNDKQDVKCCRQRVDAAVYLNRVGRPMRSRQRCYSGTVCFTAIQ
jgi:hypothetical protein